MSRDTAYTMAQTPGNKVPSAIRFQELLHTAQRIEGFVDFVQCVAYGVLKENALESPSTRLNRTIIVVMTPVSPTSTKESRVQGWGKVFQGLFENDANN